MIKSLPIEYQPREKALKEGIETLINKIGTELEDTMYMCGADSLKGITRDMVR